MECGCLGNCGNGPNAVLLWPGDSKQPVELAHLATPAKLVAALQVQRVQVLFLEGAPRAKEQIACSTSTPTPPTHTHTHTDALISFHFILS